MYHIQLEDPRVQIFFNDISHVAISVVKFYRIFNVKLEFLLLSDSSCFRMSGLYELPANRKNYSPRFTLYRIYENIFYYVVFQTELVFKLLDHRLSTRSVRLH